MLEALQHVGAKASINANLKTYRYFDNVRLQCHAWGSAFA